LIHIQLLFVVCQPAIEARLKGKDQFLYFMTLILYSMELAGTVSSKGQVTIPKHVREALGIAPGDPLECEVRGQECVVRKKRSSVDWSQFIGVLACDE
jgi:AbrB family looped-hinge helix DNA binding protein